MSYKLRKIRVSIRPSATAAAAALHLKYRNVNFGAQRLPQSYSKVQFSLPISSAVLNIVQCKVNCAKWPHAPDTGYKYGSRNGTQLPPPPARHITYYKEYILL